MRYADRGRIRRFASAFAPALLLALALPLMAPTCSPGGTGPKVFSKGSLIIPMDACYQNTPTTLTNTAYFTPYTGCPSAGGVTSDHGNVLRAYGLVYQLLRNNIPVYWVINPNKVPTGASPGFLVDTANPDLTVSLSGGPPVDKYQWATDGVAGGMPPNNTTSTINYHGGPFVVDGSDAAAARAVMQSLRATFGATPPSSTNGPNLVNVHVADVAFEANVAKSMSGGFQNSGGANAPPVALLNITGGDNKNSEVVIQGYLVDAGLGPADFAGAGGTATPTGHGKIYDDLYPGDFLPVSCTTSCANGSPCVGGKCSPSLTYFNYSILWVPHWCGKGSFNIPAGFSYLDILTAIRAFMNAGHDVMAECASLGAFEGVDNSTACNSAANTFDPGTVGQATQVQTTTGVNVNETGLNTTGGKYWGSWASPFLQLGDFPYAPVTGAIQQFSPGAAYVTRPAGFQLLRLISDLTNTSKDYFTVLPAYNGMGTVVYLAGHDFSGGQGATPQIAGSRLVLNTLFNLGSACVSTNAPCNTGKLGVCAAGTMQCVSGIPTCVQTTQPSPEICDGLDNDCNGAVDDGLTQACFEGTDPTTGQPVSPSKNGVGICHGGTKACVQLSPGVYGMSACQGQVLPAPEDCNGLDDDCNGLVDDLPPRSCFDGTSGCVGTTGGTWTCTGTCRAGTQTCTSGSWGVCAGEVLPLSYDICEPQTDTNCNGAVGDGCGCYPPGSTRICYGGPAGTENVGICRSGTQTCNPDGTLGNCTGAVLPGPRACNGLDNDCDGIVDTQQMCCDGGVPAVSRTCYGGPAGTLGVGVCRGGVQTCTNSVWSQVCAGQILPGPELCNGLDDDCNGIADDGNPVCAPGSTCQGGVCVPSTCGAEGPFCPGGYTCTGGACVLGNCGTTGAPCPAGLVCQGGACVNPCAAVVCGQGAYCSGGQCVGGGCYAAGCQAGQVCLNGVCQSDPCSGVTCPSGTFCRSGYCVQSCVFVSCQAGQRCGPDGFCVADPCVGKTCSAGQVCQNGSCVANPCGSASCGSGQVCDTATGSCVGDPCNGLTCPVGQCTGGQCYSQSSGGGPPPAVPPEAKSGCGCGAAPGGELGLLLLGLLLPWRRRSARHAAAGARRSLRGSAAALTLLLALATGSAGCSKNEAAPTTPCTNPNCNGACVDFSSDAANCGTCGHACAAGQICVAGGCGPSSAVAPYVAAVSPASAPNGATQAVSLTGQRFQAGAQVVVLGAGAQSVPASVTDSGHLSATLDFTAAAPGAAEVRVVNPDRVISNGAPFDVTLAAPMLTGLACQGASCVPAGGTAATTAVSSATAVTVTLVLSGSGLVSTSQCHLAAAGFPDMGLPSTLSGGQLQCQVDLRLTNPASYDVTVVNSGVARSNALTFTVLTTTPTLTAVSPSAAQAGQVIALTADGSGFDQTSELLLDGQATFNGSAIVTSFVSGTRLVAQPIDLRGVAAGSHSVTVRNGTYASGAQTFTVTPAAPDLSAVSPTSARQGAALTLQVTGANFDASTQIQVQAPGAGTFTAVAGTVVDSSTQAHAPYTFAQAGSWQVRVSTAAGASGALAVRVLSNVAILSGVSPASAQQGTTVTPLTLTATNLDPGGTPTVHLASPSLGCPSAPCALDLTPAVSGSTLTVASLSLAGWDAGTFAVAVVNAGAQPSNSLGFTATPGIPGLASVSPSACVMQSATPVALTLTGTNFAKPDASGNGGSTVHAASVAVPDYVVPGTTVVNPTTITVTFDTSTAVPDNYTLQIWNPGPTILKSGTIPFKVAASYAAPPLNACP